MRKKLFALLLCILGTILSAADYALILGFDTNEPADAEKVHQLCTNLKKAMEKRGIQPLDLAVYASSSSARNPMKSDILTSFDWLQERLTTQDRLFLFITGGFQANDKEIFFNSRSGELTASEIAGKLIGFRSMKLVFLIPQKPLKTLTKLQDYATVFIYGSGSFTEKFSSDLQRSQPETNIFDVLKTTGDEMRKGDVHNPEFPLLAFNGQIFKYPFRTLGTVSEQKLQMLTGPRTASPAKAKQQLKRKMTAEEKAVYDTARKLASKEDAQAVVTDRTLSIEIGKDLSASVHFIEDIYLRTLAGAAEFSYLKLKNGRVNGIRLMFPNGNINIADPNGFRKKIHTIRLNGLEAGTLLRRNYTVYFPKPQSLPILNLQFILQAKYPVCTSKITIHSTDGRKLRFKFYNIEFKVQKIKDRDVMILGSIPAQTGLPFEEPPGICAPKLIVTSLNDWNEINRAMNAAIRPAAVLDGNTPAILNILTKPHASKVAKLRAIYDCLCRLRYLTEPVGMAAIQPRSPGKMFREKYGDCKDKANALIMMARQLGIEAYPALLNRNGICDTSFPAWQFNHMLVYIPKLEGYPNGLWLDATDGEMPFGTLPAGDDGGAGFVMYSPTHYEFKTVQANRYENAVTQLIRLKVDLKNKSAEGRVSLRFSGLSDSRIRLQFRPMNHINRDYLMRKNITELLGNFEIKRFYSVNMNRQDRSFMLESEVYSTPGMFIPEKIRIPADIGQYFLLKTRTAPIKLFQGAPVKFTQEVTLEGASFPAIDYSYTGKYAELSVKASGSKRTVVIHILNAHIPVKDYAGLRAEVLRFIKQFTASLELQ